MACADEFSTMRSVSCLGVRDFFFVQSGSLRESKCKQNKKIKIFR